MNRARVFSRRSACGRSTCIGSPTSSREGSVSGSRSPARSRPSRIAPPAGCRFHTRCNAVLPHCGWSSRDIAATAAHMFDPSRNPDASELPPLEEVTIRGDEVLLLRYREPATESNRLSVEALVKARAERPEGIAFRTIQRVRLDGGRVMLEFLPAKEPELLEIAPHHFVACYLYPQASSVTN